MDLSVPPFLYVSPLLAINLPSSSALNNRGVEVIIIPPGCTGLMQPVLLHGRFKQLSTKKVVQKREICSNSYQPTHRQKALFKPDKSVGFSRVTCVGTVEISALRKYVLSNFLKWLRQRVA